MSKIVVRIPEPKQEYDVSTQKQINRSLQSVIDQLNSGARDMQVGTRLGSGIQQGRGAIKMAASFKEMLGFTPDTPGFNMLRERAIVGRAKDVKINFK